MAPLPPLATPTPKATTRHSPVFLLHLLHIQTFCTISRNRQNHKVIQSLRCALMVIQGQHF